MREIALSVADMEGHLEINKDIHCEQNQVIGMPSHGFVRLLLFQIARKQRQALVIWLHELGKGRQAYNCNVERHRAIGRGEMSHWLSVISDWIRVASMLMGVLSLGLGIVWAFIAMMVNPPIIALGIYVLLWILGLSIAWKIGRSK